MTHLADGVSSESAQQVHREKSKYKPPPVLSARAKAASVMLSLIGAIIGYYLGRGMGWIWDGVWSSLLGLFLGQTAGLLLVNVALKRPDSDGGFIFGAWIGVGAMAIVWLCGSELTVEIMGAISRAILGAACGWLLVSVAVYGD